jgi:hypothetical protein
VGQRKLHRLTRAKDGEVVTIELRRVLSSQLLLGDSTRATFCSKMLGP